MERVILVSNLGFQPERDRHKTKPQSKKT
uniref:Uncharacterized protein n=1 Tax=Anguilla anguilla TaxID=7936 RepID=A0A0E9WCK1_ANGAN